MTLNPNKVLLQQHIMAQQRELQVLGKGQLVLGVLERLLYSEH